MNDFFVTEEPSLLKGVVLRPAAIKDLNALNYVNKKCFIDKFRWQSAYPLWKNWWQAVIKSKASQTRVLEDRSGIFALDVLVLDMELWKAESKSRDGSLIDRLLSVLCCPVPAVWKRLWRVALVRFIYRNHRKISIPEQNYERTAWADYVAVLPHMAHKGYGTLLIRSREQIALEAGKTFIGTHVDSKNTPARRNIEKAGYMLISEDILGCFYGKELI